MAPGLVAAAHHPEGHGRVSVLAGHARYDRMHRALPRSDDIGVAGLSPKSEASVLQDDAALGPDQPAAEGMKQGADIADGVPVPIDNRQVGRVGVARQIAGRQVRHGPSGVDAGPQAIGMAAREHDLDRGRVMLRIADPGVPVAIGEPRSLDLEM